MHNTIRLQLVVVSSLVVVSILACGRSVRSVREDQPAGARVATVQKMPTKLMAISAGHTGCLPADIEDYRLVVSQNGLRMEWFDVWQFTCHQTRFVCSLYWIGVEGKGVDAHCSEQLEGGARGSAPGGVRGKP